MNSHKHAFLILAHTLPEQVNILTELLDDGCCDVFMHMDAKKAFLVRDVASRSNLVTLSRYHVGWGEFGMILATLELMRAALEKDTYSYLHLLSGQCMPLMPVKKIMNHFDKAFPTQFMDCAPFPVQGLPYQGLDRILVSYPPELRGRFRGVKAKEQEAFKHGTLGDPARHRPLAHMPRLCHGSQWFSITGDFALYCMEYARSKSGFCDFFESSLIPDEMFFQTILMDSPFSTSFSRDTNRYMDWTQGGPHTFRESDLPAVLGSRKCFARKFDVRKEPEIVMTLRKRILEERED